MRRLSGITRGNSGESSTRTVSLPHALGNVFLASSTSVGSSDG